LSLRSFSRLGSSISVLDFLQLGSALALRAYGRLGSSVSVLDFLHLGSSLSLRGIGRFGSCISVHDRIALGNTDTYIAYVATNNLVDFYVSGKRGLSIMMESSSGGGNLHGIWYSDHIVHTSDKRLKKNIAPLMDALNVRAKEKGATEDSANWVLRELRPVSYKFKSGPDAKNARFGFIADEVQSTIPQVVRERGKQKLKGLFYEDILAVLTAVLQQLQRQIEGSEREAEGSRHRLDLLEARVSRVEEAVSRQVESIHEGFRNIEAMIARRLPDLGASPRQRTTSLDGVAAAFDKGAATWAERSERPPQPAAATWADHPQQPVAATWAEPPHRWTAKSSDRREKDVLV